MTECIDWWLEDDDSCTAVNIENEFINMHWSTPETWADSAIFKVQKMQAMVMDFIWWASAKLPLTLRISWRMTWVCFFSYGSALWLWRTLHSLLCTCPHFVLNYLLHMNFGSHSWLHIMIWDLALFHVISIICCVCKPTIFATVTHKPVWVNWFTHQRCSVVHNMLIV